MTSVLDLTHRHLRCVPLFPSNPPVSGLFLDHNRVSSLRNLPESLQFLSISSNRLLSLTGIQLCAGLVEVNLGKNFISDEQLAVLLVLRELKKVDLSGNRLCDGFGLEQVLRLPKLEEIDVSGNAFEGLEIKSSAFCLKRLILDCNRLKTLRFSSKCEALEYLSCSDNHLTAISALENVGEIQEINIDLNEFEEIEEEFNALKELKVMNFAHNRVKSAVKLRNNLNRLDCAYNRLKSLHFLTNSRFLRDLKADHNELESLSFSGLIHLQTLQIS